jgi:hypothetical protein
VIGANRVGKMGEIKYFGHSTILGPYGETLREAGGGEEIITATLDMDKVKQLREAFPALSDRRPDTYNINKEMAIKHIEKKEPEPPVKEEKRGEKQKERTLDSKQENPKDKPKERTLEQREDSIIIPFPKIKKDKRKSQTSEKLLNTRISDRSARF